MLDNPTREKVALKKFSLISPVLNGQVENQKKYFEELCARPIDMPHYGSKMYSPKTVMDWLNDYRRGGIEALKPGYRSDRGKSRKVNFEMAEKIREKRLQKPRINGIMLYEELVKDGVIVPDRLSLATFYRFLAANPDRAASRLPETGEKRELKRFSHQWVNELWQTDIMYGPYIKAGRGRRQTYLLAFIDDASRLITAGMFMFSQNFEALRVVFKEAVLKRGVPKMIYTDNGKVYRCGQLAMLCAGLGCSLIHAESFTPTSKGKIERFFHTVRTRFLSSLDVGSIRDIDHLNLLFWRWLEEDYQRKVHSALNMSPLDFFMSQVHQITLFSNPAVLDEYFLLKVTRKVNHDATLSISNILYETDQALAGSRLEVRYDPEWLKNPSRPVFLYRDGKMVGEARQVNFHDNARVKRKGPGRPKKQPGEEPVLETDVSTAEAVAPVALSFARIMGSNYGEKPGNSGGKEGGR